MYLPDLQSYIAQLEKIDDLVRISVTVDPHLEVATIIDRVCKGESGRRALLFENVKEAKLSLAANLFGSQQRMAMALGVTDVEALAERLRMDLMLSTEKHSGRALAQLTRDCPSDTMSSEDASCFGIDITDQGFGVLPALQAWPGDGGRYLTLGQIFTRHPETGQLNCGMYRVQIVDHQTALIRFHRGSGGGVHLEAWHGRKEPMPVAVVLGGPPALTWCAGVSLPDDVSEIEFISYLSEWPLAITQCPATGLSVPSTAEIVIEGYILPGEEQDEGPFGNHTGYYDSASPAPIFRVKCAHMKEGAIYPCTVVGPPPMENIYLAQAALSVMLPLLQHDYPWVVDVHMPLEGIYHRAAMVVVDAHGKSMAEIGKTLWQSRLLRNASLIVLFDKDCDLFDAANSYWRIINSGSWQNTVLIDDNKMIIDARRMSSKSRVRLDQITVSQVLKRWPDFGL
jgi:4-hydroxy-3-polyprenylbenzoate decarboxylase